MLDTFISGNFLNIEDDTIMKDLPVDHRYAIRNFVRAGGVLWNATDSFDGMCEAVWNADLPAKLLGALQNQPGLAPNMIGASMELGDGTAAATAMATRLCKTFISILMNSLRRCRDNTQLFRAAGGVEIILGYRNTACELVNVVASCLLAYGSSEEQVKTLPDMGDVVLFLTQVLDEALASERRYPHYRRGRGFTVEEILSALKSMAAQDAVQTTLVQAPHLRSLAAILRQPGSTDELRLITNIFWTLAFNDDIREAVKAGVPDLATCLQQYSKHDHKKVVKAVAGCLWKYEGIVPNKSPTGKMKKKGYVVLVVSQEQLAKPLHSTQLNDYVMVSYDWGHQETVLSLNQALKAHGFKTWIDIEQMSGSTLEAMARAVEGASVVLICISERYKDSPNCRAEAEYAFQQHKPIVPVRMQASFRPDGWLGMVMGTKFYFDCHSENDAYLAAESLSAEIRQSVGTHDEAVKVGNTGSRTDPKSPEKVISWDSLKTSKFLDKHKLSHIYKKFGKEFDGTDLRELARLSKSGQTIYMSILSSYGIHGAQDILRLTKALHPL